MGIERDKSLRIGLGDQCMHIWMDRFLVLQEFNPFRAAAQKRGGNLRARNTDIRLNRVNMKPLMANMYSM